MADDSGAEDDGTSTDTGEPSCTTATDCEACLAIAGCNWTADMCEASCFEDASCYGPGNPAAPICPDPTTTGGECADLGSSCAAQEQCCDGLVCQGDLVPTCVDPQQCLPDGAECSAASECCDGRDCTGEEVDVCTPVACAAEGESCASAPCCDAEQLYCEPELQLCVLPPD